MRDGIGFFKDLMKKLHDEMNFEIWNEWSDVDYHLTDFEMNTINQKITTVSLRKYIIIFHMYILFNHTKIHTSRSPYLRPHTI